MVMRQAGEAQKLVTVFGGSGFVGRHLVRLLAKRGYRVRVAVRRPDLAGFLLPDGAVGQIALVQANVRYPESVRRAVAGSDAVVNLVGILSVWGKQTFDAVQAEGAGAVAQACADAGIETLVHVSALGADAKAESDYARTKAAGEAAVLKAMPSAVILRPSVMFGIDDNFFNKFASLAALFPFLPLIGGGKTLFQPVYVGDVAEAIATAIEGGAKPGTVYEIGGPEKASFRALMERVLAETRRKRWLLSVPFGLASFEARFLELLPHPLLTRDQVTLLKSDNVVSEAAVAEGRALADLGVQPTSMAAVLPTYLYRFLPHGQYDVENSAG